MTYPYMPNPAPRAVTFRRLLILFILLLLFTAAAALIQFAWLGPSLSLEIPIDMSVRWMQLITTLLSFLLPALCWALLERRSTPSPLATSRPSPATWLLYGLAVGLLMVMPNTLLTELNASIPQPDWAAEMDKRVQEASYALLAVDTLPGYLVNTLVIAIAPAICEELFFRGALQQSLLRLIRSPHAAIWICAAFFSLIHFQLSGFLPRLALGAALGYLAYYSRSVWPAVIMHFTNNFIAVTLATIAFRNGDIEQFDHPTPWVAWPFALLCMGLIIAFFVREGKKQSGMRQPS